MKKVHLLLFSLATLTFITCKKDSNELIAKIPTSKFLYLEKMTWIESAESLTLESNGKKLNFALDELPLKSAMVVPTSVIAYMDELGLTEKITGISQSDYVFNPKIHSLIHENKIAKIGSFNEIFIENVLLHKPDIFISTSSPTLAKYHELLQNKGVKILLIDEYEELTPLAKAEYIKIVGKLFGKENEANQRFLEIEKNYLEIQSTIKEKTNNKPSVFVNQIYGDVWYMPGGKSFQSLLIQDAGGNYLWKIDSSTGSLNLSFESVFEKANDANFWINAGDYPSKKALLATYPNYEWFAAYKNGNIYNWNKRMNEKGANDYFETGVVRPDLVLKDLASIFHPDFFPKHELFFYKKLE